MYKITSASFFLVTSFFIEGAMAVHDVLVARQETSSSSASAASPSAITLSPYLYFTSISQATTCEPLAFSWFYSGPNSVFTFYVTNVGVLQSGAPPPLTLISSSSSPPPSHTFTDVRRAVPTAAAPVPLTTTVALAANVPGPLLDLTWSAVTVPRGWYVINATTQSPQYTVLSPAFFVRTGADTSCLLPVTGSTGVPMPVGGSSTSTGGAGTGTIIGATIGSVAFVAALFAIWLCFLRRKRNRSQGGGGGDFRKGLAHRWNGLSSTDAGLTGGGAMGSYQHQAHRVGSIGTFQTTPSDEAAAAEKYSTTGKFDDDTTSNGHEGLAYLPVLAHHHGQPKALPLGRTYSTSSSVSAHGGPPQNEVYASTPAPLRRASIADSMHGRQSVDSTTYPPTSPTRHSTLARTHSNRSTAQSNLGYPSSPTSPQGGDNYPTSPIDATVKLANRHSLGRKRKPVPAYDPNQDPSSPVSPAAFQAPPVPSPSPHSSDPSPSPEPSTVSQNANGGGGGGGHYATRSQLGQDHSAPDLTHKSSFGPGGVEGKPLHYLIPDMPMPLGR